MTKPSPVPAPIIADTIPRPWPIRRGGSRALMRPKDRGSAAAPAPCIARARSRTGKFHARAASTVPAPKTASEASRTRRLPRRSPKRASTGVSTAPESR
ncbi:hypothetical protein QFZ82_003244 [Streptomyces sp. V4I23]|nr:hypothetical protein [Streptomyces sp. V4I23]